MSYKAFQSKYNPSAWLVLLCDHDKPDETLVSFTGKNAKELAEEYAAWKNSDKLWRPPVEWKAMETGRSSSNKPNGVDVERLDPASQLACGKMLGGDRHHDAGPCRLPKEHSGPCCQ